MEAVVERRACGEAAGGFDKMVVQTGAGCAGIGETCSAGGAGCIAKLADLAGIVVVVAVET